MLNNNTVNGIESSHLWEHIGFTLIELLVSISIISLLSSVVLAGFQEARRAAKEATILSSLNSAQTQATAYLNKNKTYKGLCDSEKINKIVSSLSATADDASCWEASQEQDGPGKVEDTINELAKRDWGIGVKLDSKYYAGSPLGSGTFETKNESPVSGKTDWDNARTACQSDNKRLPSPSALRAVFAIIDDLDENNVFTEDSHWSAFDNQQRSSEALRVRLDNGSIYSSAKTSDNLVRCIR